MREVGEVHSLEYIASEIRGEVVGNGKRKVRRVGPLEGCTEDCIVFIRDRKYYDEMEGPKTAAFVLDFHPDHAEGIDYILVKSDDRDRVFIALLSLFEDVKDFGSGVSEHAEVAPDATLGDGVVVDAYAVIGDSAIGEGRLSVGTAI
jgi:UDP-3-O-[3-hydroxymyristoyl] glucosamine N-acyltransferase